MAIGNAAVELLIKLRTAEYLEPEGAVIEIGAQQLSDSLLAAPDRVAHLGRLFGTDQPLPLPRSQQSRDNEFEDDWAILTAPFARDFWQWLGFDYASVDIDGSPRSIPLDLNYDSVPSEAKGKYQLVTNFGTTEHIVNQLNAFNIIHDLTAPNGIMIHEVPVQGMVNHGLINYNFKFFWMLARSNGYKIIHADFMPAKDQSDLPDNIAEFLARSKLTAQSESLDYKVRDAGLLLAMQKSFDIAFVPPLDVDTGASTDFAPLKERYWTVFDPEALDQLRPRETRSEKTQASLRNSLAPVNSARVDRSQNPTEITGTSGSQGLTDSDLQVSTMSNPTAPSTTSTRTERPADAVGILGKLGNLMMGWARMGRNVAATAQGIANQTDVIVQKTSELAAGIANQTEAIVNLTEGVAAVAAAIANQSDLTRNRLDALTRVMHELRQIQKAQLAMQREASEAIRQLGGPAPPPDNQSAATEFPLNAAGSKPVLKS